MRTFIIAEAGVNHNGDVKIAKKLIDVAVDAGADAIKFQTFKAENIVISSAPKAKYQMENTGIGESQFEMLKKLELSASAFKELFAFCKEKNIIFISTPFDEESTDFLDSMGMEIFKIPSGEVTNKPLIQHIASKGKPIFLSTGMSYLGEVEKAVFWINEIWDRLDKKPGLTLLHCTSNYPASEEDSNLLTMKTMEVAFGLPVGYSDHTPGIGIPIAAVALGARVIEKHFTLDKNMQGPDHRASLEPDELRAMVSAIRRVELALGDGIKKPAKSEAEMRKVARRSIVLARDVKAGEIITANDITIKRPGTGIQPEFLDLITGMRVKKDMSAESVLKWDDFKDA